MRRFIKRQKLPFKSTAHFKDFVSEDNLISATLTNMPYTGLEALAFILFADRVIDLRPTFKETLGAQIRINKGSNGDKSLSDEDVWFSHLEIMDDTTICLNFIVLTF